MAKPPSTPTPAASLRDVAALAGVSVGTVSNVLNHPAKVSEQTAERVFAAIRDLGFVRNEAARQLRQGHSRSIGLIVLDIRNPFFTDVAQGVEDEATARSRSVLLANCAEDAARESAYLDLFEEQRVDGLLISPVGDVLDRLDRLRSRGMAVILLDRLASTESYSSVSVDDERGGRLAVEHLLETGRRRITFVGASTDIEQVRDRLAGGRRAVEGVGNASLDYREITGMHVAPALAEGERIVALPADERPDAVFAANDLIAMGMLQAFTRGGLRTPDDIALIGYDDIDYAASAAIPLSSVRQPSREMGRRAAELLLAEIEAGGSGERQHIVFAPELVARASTLG
ncbi:MULTISPECIES: LacI family DNA-binding transcriptional regulator [unclassified Mumia]|uniref:LacI family DNA-binding transcriptional regulator n=1 Tax=unclassified Mumia TaxID=2621872 RepID=UPI002628C72B|nr:MULTISPECIES: LacI family DNA-binding transcriptional regulator [unclassified Mumia]MDD9348442.1 LacI family DNA-binding transcriptional regulator [Mumia sp.]